MNSRQRQWRKQHAGELVLWDSPNQELEGVFLGIEENGVWPNGNPKIDGKIQLDDGNKVVRFGINKVLGGLLESVSKNSTIKIVYLGKRRGKTGQDYNDFEVFVDDSLDVNRPAGESPKHGTADDDIPF